MNYITRQKTKFTLIDGDGEALLVSKQHLQALKDVMIGEKNNVLFPMDEGNQLRIQLDLIGDLWAVYENPTERHTIKQMLWEEDEGECEDLLDQINHILG